MKRGTRRVADPAQELLRRARKQFFRGLIYAGLLSGFINLLQLIVPIFMLQTHDRVLNSRSTDTLLMLVLIAAAGLIVFAILEYIRARVYIVMGNSLARRLNLPTLQAAVAETLEGHSARAPQAIRDLNDLRGFVTGNAISVPLEMAWMPLFLAVLFMLHPAYGIVALISGAILIVFSILSDLVSRRTLAEASEASAEAYGDVTSAIRNAEVIEAMGMLPAVARRWQHAQKRMLDLLDQGQGNGKAVAAVSRACRYGMQISVLSVGVLLVIDQQATPGSMIAASIIMGRLLLPFEQLIDGWRQWVFAHAAYGRIRDLLEKRSTRRQSMALPRPEGHLRVERLVYMPPGVDRPVIKGISFALQPGQVLGVIGPSASGKSTLARLLVGIWKPTAGGIYLDGHDVFLWERENFGAYVGYLPQSVSLLDGTVRQNIARMRDADPAEVVKAARAAGIHEMIGRFPFGYDTVVGDGGYSLSGGQRQRIALARALFGQPRLLVLDEPNSNLDHDGERALLNTIRMAKEGGATVVIIAHRPSVMAVADKLLVLKDGLVEQFGDRTDVIQAVTPGAPARAKVASLHDRRGAS
jgi:ATP-binding cassette subfamily C protein